MKTFIDQMKLRKGILLGGTAILGGMTIFGMILHDVIQMVEDAEDVFPMGGIMGMMAFFLIAILIIGQDFWQSFNHAVSMSQARRRFIPTYIASMTICQVIYIVILKILIVIERCKLSLMYPTLPYEGDFSLIFSWKILGCIAIACLGIGLMIGAMLLKFGKVAYVIVWVLWMAVCIGIPKLMDYAQNNSNTVVARFVKNVAEAFSNSSPAMLVIAVMAVSAILVLIGCFVIRKQAVNN